MKTNCGWFASSLIFDLVHYYCRWTLTDLGGPGGQFGPEHESSHEPGHYHCHNHDHDHHHYQAELVACPGPRNLSRQMPDYPLGQ